MQERGLKDVLSTLTPGPTPAVQESGAQRAAMWLSDAVDVVLNLVE